VTGKHNLRCFYLLPEGFRDFGDPVHWLRVDEIERVARAFGEVGVSRVRIPGGEPLVRKHLPRLAGQLATVTGIGDLSLNTNVNLLGRHARPLKQAGISRINISLVTVTSRSH
jgi:cyclic pyranopterin phosphate synthase